MRALKEIILHRLVCDDHVCIWFNFFGLFDFLLSVANLVKFVELCLYLQRYLHVELGRCVLQSLDYTQGIQPYDDVGLRKRKLAVIVVDFS